MEFLDGNVSDESDNGSDDFQYKHDKLIDSIVSIDGKKRKINPKRCEPTTEVSEFGIKDAKAAKVQLHELALSLGKTKAHTLLKKEIYKSKRRQKVLPVPLSKPDADRIKRGISYDKVKNEASKWDGIVEKNRLATTMTFPLQQPNLKLKTGPERAKDFKPMTPLEVEITALLGQSKNVLKDDRLLTEAEEAAFKAMSSEQALEVRSQMQKMRALQSHMEAKARRQNKIKSKSYHRLLKKEELKRFVKEFEELKQTNPEAAIEKLDEINKQRIEERMTLRHRGTGKWAKHMALRAKYDKQSRHALTEQLLKNRELTQKQRSQHETEDEEISFKEACLPKLARPTAQFNPWLHGRVVESNEEEEEKSTAHYSKVWKQARDELELMKEQQKVTTEENANARGLDEKVEKNDETTKVVTSLFSEISTMHVPEGIKKKKKLLGEKKKKKILSEKKTKMANKQKAKLPEKVEEPHPLEKFNDDTAYLTETAGGESDYITPKEGQNERVITFDLSNVTSNVPQRSTATEPVLKVDPQNFVTVKSKRLKSAIPNNVIVSEDEEEDEREHLMTIEEAFADDDVVQSFREEKQSKIDQSKPKDIDKFLPGWGSWGGKGVKENRLKRKRFLIKAPELPKRKDQDLTDVFINEDKEKDISKLQVSEIPFPFTNVHEYEKTLQAPIGKMWNAETAFKELTVPKVITRMGKIIEPIDADALINKKAPRRVIKNKSVRISKCKSSKSSVKN